LVFLGEEKWQGEKEKCENGDGEVDGYAGGL
jgi:hypothetical protein